MKTLISNAKCVFIIGMFCLSLVDTARSQGIVSENDYKIIARHSDKVLEVVNGGTTNGTNVQQATYSDSTYQQWKFTKLADGYWRISPLHRTNATLRRSTKNAEMRSFSDEDTRKWSLVDVGDGYFQIVSKGYDTEFGVPGCISIAGGSTDDGANAAVSDAVDTLRYQHFTFESLTGGTPKISINYLSLPLGFAPLNTPSAEQAYTVEGTSLSPASGNITITAPGHFEVSATSGSGFTTAITVPYSDGTLATTTIYVRFTPTALQSYSGSITNSGGGAATQDLLVSGEGADYSTPTLIINHTSLPIGYTLVNEPSREMVYTITGYGLSPASGDISVTAPEGFQVSKTSGTGFSSSLTVPYTGGGIIETSVYTRLVPTEVKSYSGSITNEGGGVGILNITVNGAGVNPLPDDKPIGFGQHTTGGAGGTVVSITTFDELKDYASRDGKYIIKVKGTIENTSAGMMYVSSDKTIIGLGTDATIKGFGLRMGLPVNDATTTPPENRIKNVIIRNLNFYDSPDDNINATMFTENIWIDHCAFYTQADGAIDIIRGSDWVTISWCHFVGCAKTSLIGHSDDNDHQSTGRLHATYHHNSFWYTKSRNPRGRYGKIHSFNNQIFRMGDYGIGVGYKSNHYIENQYFWRAGDAWQLMYEGGHEGILDNAGWVRETGNIYDTDCGRHPTVMPPDDLIWHPLEYYYYEAKPAEWVRDVLLVTDVSDMDNPKIISQLTGPRSDIVIGIEENAFPAGKGSQFIRNYPNPFNETTTIEYNLYTPGNVVMKVYNCNGEEIETLTRGFLEAGKHEYTWQPKGLSGGIYYLRIQTDDSLVTRKLILQN